MVRLQKVLAYIHRDREGKDRRHYKNFVNLPDEAIERLGWGKGQELEWEIQGNLLLLKPVGRLAETQRVKPVKAPKHIRPTIAKAGSPPPEEDEP